MLKTAISLIFILLIFSTENFGQNQTDFSGKWIYYKNIPSTVPQKQPAALFKVEIVQTKTDVKLTTLVNDYPLKGGGRDENGSIVYLFDKESNFAVQSEKSNITGKLKAELKNKNKLSLNSLQAVKSGSGDYSLNVNETFHFLDDGKTLEIKREVRDSRGLPVYEMYLAKKQDSSAIQTNNVYNAFEVPSLNSKNVNNFASFLSQPPHNGINGMSEVIIIFDEEGTVIFAQNVGGGLVLGNSSVEAAMKSTFKPVKLNDKPIKVEGLIIYIYTQYK